MKQKTKALVAIITLLIMLPFTVTPSSAMKPITPKERYGVTAKGIVNITTDSPVVLESQTITFNLLDYPKYEYENPDEFKEYGSTVTTEYRLYNPTATTETVKLILPFGTAPEYGECHTALFEVTVNGKDAGGEIQQVGNWFEEEGSNLPSEYYTPSDWYVYEITLGSEERSTTAVTTPVYPTVSQQYDPETYNYYYIYSPYDRWEEYGCVDVVINTDYYLLEYGYDYGFTEAEGGYTLHVDDLHTVLDEYTSTTETGVSFSLSSSENPEYIEKTGSGGIIFAILLWIIIPVVLIIELVRTVVQLIGKGINYVINLFK